MTTTAQATATTPATAALHLSLPPLRLLRRFPEQTKQLLQEISSSSPNLANVAALMSTCGATLTTTGREKAITGRRTRREKVCISIILPYWAASASDSGESTARTGWRPGHISTYRYPNRQGRLTTVTLQLAAHAGSILAGVAAEAGAGRTLPLTGPAASALTHTPFEETRRWSCTLAETPTDPMGDDHFRFMGRFMGCGRAEPDAFEALAINAFEQRLANSRRYGTHFAEQVSPGWRTGKPTKRYLERWSGVYPRLIWSFGIKDHPRAGVIWHMMRERLPREPDAVTREFFQDVSDMEDALRPETVAVRSWTFAYRCIELMVFLDKKENFFLCHAQSSDIPTVIRPRLTELWNATLDRSRGTGVRLHSLAEFEWLWYWTNPFVRGGATTGSLLSAFLRRSMHQEGMEIRMRYTFVMQDLYALTTDCKSYMRERVAQLACRKDHLMEAYSSIENEGLTE